MIIYRVIIGFFHDLLRQKCVVVIKLEVVMIVEISLMIID